jgi:hypothetical protein
MLMGKSSGMKADGIDSILAKAYSRAAFGEGDEREQ